MKAWGLRKSPCLYTAPHAILITLSQAPQPCSRRVRPLPFALALTLALILKTEPNRLFYGQWPASPPSQGRTDLLVEQVSHHPPITAYVIENKVKGLRLHGHNAQKTSFSGTQPVFPLMPDCPLTLPLLHYRRIHHRQAARPRYPHCSPPQRQEGRVPH